MKLFKIFKFSFVRSIKLFFYYIICLPFFILRIFIIKSDNNDILYVHKLLLIIIGEVWLFGRNVLDLREVYENQRIEFKNDHSITKLLKYLPGQWFTLSPLETALTLLMSSNENSNGIKFFYAPYVLYLLLFDESRHVEKANHGIACSLALSYAFKRSRKISNFYYLKALKILRSNSNAFFYDEGSTNYHIFVTSLFKFYFNLMRKKPSWFKGYEDISINLLNSKDYFYFGDDDKSSWLYKVINDLNFDKNLNIISLLKNKRFKRSIIDRYFAVYAEENRILLLCTNGSKWGHAHLMVGSFLYFVDNKPSILFKKNNEYTLNKNIRRKDRTLSCNSPVNLTFLRNVELEYFKKIPNEFLTSEIHEENNKNKCITIITNGCKREIDISNQQLIVCDSSINDDRIISSLESFHNPDLIHYSNLTSP